jgi:hypothetical protein
MTTESYPEIMARRRREAEAAQRPSARAHLAAVPTSDALTSAYATAAMTKELNTLAAATEGTRNHALNTAAYSLYQLVDHGHLDEHAVTASLTTVAHGIGLLAHEVTATLASARRGAQSKPRDAPVLTGGTDVPPLPAFSVTAPGGDPGEADLDAARAAISTIPPALDWHALWADDSTEEWIVEPLIPARRGVAFYSPPKAGKSLLMLEVVVAIANGTEALGNKLDRPRKVLYVDFENDPRGDIRARLQAMGYGPDDLANLHYLSYPTIAPLDTALGAVQLIAAAQHYQCELIVIDTISRAVAGEENDNDTWLNLYRHLGLRLKQHGLTYVRLDHSGKDQEKGMRGGSAKYGDIDIVWKLSVVDDKTVRLDCTDHRLPVPEKTLVLHRELIPHLHHRVDSAGRAAAAEIKRDEVIFALDDLGVPDHTGVNESMKALATTAVKARRATVSAAVKFRQTRVGMFVPGSEEA